MWYLRFTSLVLSLGVMFSYLLPQAEAKVHIATFNDAIYLSSIEGAKKKLVELDLKQKEFAQSTKQAAYLKTGITENEFSQWQQSLAQQVLNLQQTLSLYDQLNDAQTALDDQRDVIASWSGFKNVKPPYSLTFVESLRDIYNTTRLSINIYDSDLILAKSSFNDAQTRLQSMVERQNELANELDLTKGTAEEPLFRLRLAMTSDLLDEIGSEVLKEGVQQHLIELRRQARVEALAFQRKQLSLAMENYVLTQEEKDQKIQELNAQRAANQKDITQYKELLLKAKEEAEIRTREYDQLNAGHGDQQKLELAKLRMQSAQLQQAFLADKLDELQLTDRLDEQQIPIWQKRYEITHGGQKKAVTELTDALTPFINEIKQFRPNLPQTQQQLQQQMDDVRNQLSSSAPNSEQASLLREQMNTLQKWLLTLDLFESNRNTLVNHLERWQKELTEHEYILPFREKMRMHWLGLEQSFKTVWNYNVFTAQDKTVVNGALVNKERNITVGKVVFAVLMVLLGLVLSKVAANLINKSLLSRVTLHPSNRILLSSWIFYLCLAVFLIIALGLANIPLTIFAFLGGALAIGIGFGAQNIINNFISGLLILTEKLVKIGDTVEVGGELGTVTHVGSRCSRVRKFDGVEILIPNSVFIQESVTNWTLSDRTRRFELKVGVAYGSPTDKVTEILKRIASNHPDILPQPPVKVYFENFGDNTLDFSIIYWLEMRMGLDAREVSTQLHLAIDQAFREAAIEIAFPQRDVHLDVSKPIEIKKV